MTIRDETPADYDAIRELNRSAFATDAEAWLANRLRAGGLAIASLAAVEDGPALRAVSLAPIAVVLGHPEYCPRFGFSAVLASSLRNPFLAKPSDAWMALELRRTPGPSSIRRPLPNYNSGLKFLI